MSRERAIPDKPIADRLQVKPGRTLAVEAAPAGLDALIDAADRRAATDAAEVVLVFVADRAALDARLPKLVADIRMDAILWVAYPKLTSRLAGDLNRDVIHGLVPTHGLTTVAQIAIDGDWSAMRLKRVG